MPIDIDARRKSLKDALQKAQIYVSQSLAKIDTLGPYEIAEIRGAAEPLAAFFDKNGSCAVGAGGGGGQTVDQSEAFFDKNGSC